MPKSSAGGRCRSRASSVGPAVGAAWSSGRPGGHLLCRAHGRIRGLCCGLPRPGSRCQAAAARCRRPPISPLPFAPPPARRAATASGGAQVGCPRAALHVIPTLPAIRSAAAFQAASSTYVAAVQSLAPAGEAPMFCALRRRGHSQYMSTSAPARPLHAACTSSCRCAACPPSTTNLPLNMLQAPSPP